MYWTTKAADIVLFDEFGELSRELQMSDSGLRVRWKAADILNEKSLNLMYESDRQQAVEILKELSMNGIQFRLRETLK